MLLPAVLAGCSAHSPRFRREAVAVLAARRRSFIVVALLSMRTVANVTERMALSPSSATAVVVRTARGRRRRCFRVAAAAFCGHRREMTTIVTLSFLVAGGGA